MSAFFERVRAALATKGRRGAVPHLRWRLWSGVPRLETWGRPSGPPQVADMDWAFATLARWRLATLLDAARDRRACTSYARVAAAWAQGDSRYRARADSAARRAMTMGCKQRL
ncbi:MAG: hypothetical protein DMD34_05625 [Gemmatimonadetes bacterium]|nr:MAG: hypothetical protein DMD34_05625 [Gemmatimonadota bacterium]